MKIHDLHPWDVTADEAIELQRELARRVETGPALTEYDLVAGADISYSKYSNTLYAGVVVLRASDWTVVEKQCAVTEATFPYRTGLLSFREAPAVLEVFKKVEAEPDVILLDGQGQAHPRRLGLACHLGLWLDRPCVGCGKTRLTGTFEDLGPLKGDTAPLTVGDEVVGQAVRTKNKTRPLFVSVGHKIDLASSVAVVLAACQGYRQPEPTRQAHLYVNELRRSAA